MRVLILNDFASVRGGSDQVALAEARGLARRGHRVTLWTAVGPVDPVLEHVPGLDVRCLGGMDILNDPDRLRAMTRGLWNREAARALGDCLAGQDPTFDVAHVHGWSKGLTASIFPVLRGAGLEPVISLHDYFVACPNGTFHDHPRNEPCGRRPLGAACLLAHCDSRSYAHKLWRFVRHSVQARCAGVPGAVRHLVSLSDHAESVIRPFLPAGVRVHRLPNPVDVASRPPVDVRRNRDITYLGRLTHEKGVLVLATAVGGQVPGGLSVVFAGEGELRGEIARLAPTATVTGWLDRSGVDAVLERTRVLVCPSVCHETFGLTAAEARARGIPVIVSDRCATREQVRDGVEGWHFRQGDASHLRDVLREVADDDRVATRGRSAYDSYWASPLGLDSHLDALERIYDEVRDGGTGAAGTVR